MERFTNSTTKKFGSIHQGMMTIGSVDLGTRFNTANRLLGSRMTAEDALCFRRTVLQLTQLVDDKKNTNNHTLQPS